MNINLNLATRPYLELRPVYARLRVAAIALAVLALPMLLVLHTTQAKAREAQARVSQVQANIALLQREQARNAALAREGPNATVLDEAAFLNGLFRRKAFSWTATMSDLEHTLPPGVQVQAIEPVAAPDGRVTIRMRITGARERAVEVVHNLEHSKYFVSPRLTAEALSEQTGGNARQVNAAAGGPGDVTFDILAEYRPLPNTHETREKPQRPARTEHAQESPSTPQLTPPQAIPEAAPAPRPVRQAPRPYGKPLPTIPAPLGDR